MKNQETFYPKSITRQLYRRSGARPVRAQTAIRTVLGLLAFAGISLAQFAATADVIYRETFGIPPGASADLYATNFDWQRFDNNGAQITTGGSSAGVNFSATGRLTDVANTNAGPNSDGTFAAYVNGILYLGATPSPSLALTTEYTVNPDNYEPGSIVFSWYEGNNTAPHFFRLIVRVGGFWYASTNTFTTATVSLANFGTLAELKSLTYDPAASKWLALNFNGDYVPGITPGAGTTTNSSAGALSLGGNPGAALSGPITGFGVYGENGGTGSGNRRIDTFTITATPATIPPTINADLTNKVAEVCNATSFSVGAAGSQPLGYFWFFNDAPTTGSGNSLSLANVGLLDVGSYYVIVSNAVGKATSSVVSLSVIDTTAPVISNCPSTSLVADASCQGIIPDLTGSVVATDCSGVLSITQDPPAGTLVGAGQHSVTFTVTDISNNVAMCEGSVTVGDDTAPMIITCASDQYLNANFSQQAVIPDLTGMVSVTNRCNSAVVLQNPAPGTVVGPGAHVVTLTATTFANNIDQCTATVFVNGRPVASNASASEAINNPVAISLSATDAEGGPLTFYIVSGPSYGMLGSLNSNLVTYTPNEGFIGGDSFDFEVSDGQVTSAVATVSITITNLEIVYPDGPQITKDGTAILLSNYVSLPLSSRTTGIYGEGNIDFGNQLARVNFLRSEPANASQSSTRFMVCDNNRNLYFLIRTNNPLTTASFQTYINFERVFPKFDNDPGYAGGLVSFQFDPEYASNGIFYTVHTEDPAKAGSAVPTNGALPGLNPSGYTTTPAINPPVGSVTRQSVLVEWKDSNVNNATFEGTAREILRVGFNSNIHPMGDLLFNPLVKPGDWDYRNLYVANGDGGAGESSSTRAVPQRLDAIQGKILRITPDITLRPADLLVTNGTVSVYRIPTTGPDPNPFVSLSLANLRKEIFAYGFRNCHRISWDDVTDTLLEDDIGLHSWEEVNIIHKGLNYGYSEREGTEQLFVGGANNGRTGSQISPAVPFPANDSLTVNGIATPVTPRYPAAQYSHADGDAIASGFVYRGSLMPQLRGKYIFGEITTGRILYCDLAEMIAKDDEVRTTVATVHEIQVVFNGSQRRLFDVISDEYKQRGGTSGNKLPGSANATAGSDIDGVAYGRGRADIRLAVDSDGEMYVLSKSDGMIRKMVAALSPPMISSVVATSGNATLTWPAISNKVYRVQFKSSLNELNWTDLPGDVTATSSSASKMDASGATNRFYRIVVLP